MSIAVLPPYVDCTEHLSVLAAQREDRNTAVAAESKVMVVDDEPTNIKVVKRLLELEGYARFVTTTDATDAVTLLRDEQPDILLLDLMMPHVSGLDILRRVHEDDELSFIPIIILTAVNDRETKLQALELGATDFLGKPLDPSELTARVRNVLAAKAYQNRLQNYSKDLERAVRQRTTELEASRRDVIHCLARAAEYRDDDTGFHIIRVGKYVHLIAKSLGMSDEEADALEQASQLHDVGKIGIPDDILLKPGKLTSDEFSSMQKHCGFGKHILHPANIDEEKAIRRHTEMGARILGSGTSPVLALAERIALTHHEWWDGTGYPFKLVGEEIPLEGRITALADVFDALSSKRCYKEALPLDKCFEIMQSERGTHFDPRLLDLFIGLRKAIASIQLACADEK
ncbi:MAG: HD domain-containing phosphohydrolase [Pirellulales bacterium]